MIKAATFGGYDYKYSIISYTPSGKQYTLGGADDLSIAIDTAKRQAKSIFDSPWESDEDKLARLQMLSIIDDENDEAVEDDGLEDYIWNYIDKLDGGNDE